jgi:NADPH-dependent 7-cyano-7-deazaguanine reductase QueF
VNRRAKRGVEEREEECVEEIFGQLWMVPRPDKVRVPDSSSRRGCFIWVRKDLVVGWRQGG